MLISKLHVKPGMHVAVLNTPPGLDRTIGKLPAGVTRAASLKAVKGALDLVVLFVVKKEALQEQWPNALKALKTDGALWIAHPKKGSGIDSDLTAMGGDWGVSGGSVWQPVSRIAVDETWSAVCFRQRPGLAQARQERQEESIHDADGTVCIDRKNRIVTPPGDLQKLLDRNTKARALFETLSFTHKREYVGWIIEAKRAETRAARLTKAIDMMSKGKKNPSEK
jgi:Bacteriocin-protection, YdeI or OmpD-Associated